MVNSIDLNFFEHVAIILMHLPIQNLSNVYTNFKKKKMVVGDGGWFLEKYALEFAEIPLESFHHPYTYTHETSQQN